MVNRHLSPAWPGGPADTRHRHESTLGSARPATRRIAGLAAAILGAGAALPTPAAEDAAGTVIEIVDRDNTRTTRRGTFLPGAPRRLPFSSERIDPRRLEHQPAADLGTLLAFVGAASVSPGEGGAVNDFVLRGFADTTVYRNGLNDSRGIAAPRDLANIEQVEVLRGAAAALYGDGEPGGAINFVTKAPRAAPRTEISLDAARFGERSLLVDSTGAVPGLPGLAHRVVTSRRQGDTFRSGVKDDHWLIAPALAWHAGEGIDFIASAEYVRDRRLLDAGIFDLPGVPSVDPANFLGEAAAGPARHDGFSTQLEAGFALPDDWSLSLQAAFQRTVLGGAAVEPAAWEDGRLLRELQRRHDASHAWETRAELERSLRLGATEHALRMGVTAIVLREAISRATSDSDAFPFDIDPFARARDASPLPPVEPERDSLERRRQYAIHFNDLVTLSEHWRTLFALRYDHVAQRGRDAVAATRFDQTFSRVSPRLGVVYDSLRGALAYASFSRAFAANEGLQPDGRALAPTRANAGEIGLRWTPPTLPLTLDAAFYAIFERDVANDAPGMPGFEIQSGRQRSHGVEVDLRWQPRPALELRARYHWLDARLSDGPQLATSVTPLNAPRHSASLLAFYHHRVGATAFDLGLAANYVGRRRASLDPDELDVRLGDYLRFDLFARCAVSAHLTVHLGITNLTDTAYLAGSQGDAFSLYPGAPRSVSTGLRLRF
ncbi:MAG: TonB-dependent siderophore receptor [Gammaproteobacteria bacterium]|nr:TonB-dependent siderophore receptor [Gammaproteobacteria bacterium]